MAYHPDPGSRQDHQMQFRKPRCVESTHARNFPTLKYVQPFMVLHEPAQAYLCQFVPNGFVNHSIRQGYEQAVGAKLDDQVLTIRDKHQRHSAADHPQEFFAEATGAYFGTNDYFPPVRSVLSTHDAGTFELMRRIWGK